MTKVSLPAIYPQTELKQNGGGQRILENLDYAIKLSGSHVMNCDRIVRVGIERWGEKKPREAL